MDLPDNIFGLLFDESTSQSSENPSLISFDMWCQCSLKNIKRTIRRNQYWKPIRLYLLKIVLDFCKLADINPFIYAGTALAVYRENGRMIKHDSDIDLAVLERDGGVGAFTKLLQTCIRHGVSYSGVAGEFPPFDIYDNSDITISFNSRVTGKSWLRVNAAGVTSICEEFYSGTDCKIAKFFFSRTGIKRVCDIFGKGANTLNQLMSDPSLAHVDLFTFSPHQCSPDSHLQVNWDIPGVYNARRKAFPTNSILPLKEYTFEGISVLGPAELESYLKTEYGYLGRDAIFDVKEQMYVKIPDNFRDLVPRYMLSAANATNPHVK
ncbi:X prolyl aminopeptidase [Fasciolopsis buskii]|uniref:X prolyl aminopeptidase n=1 Tax=Fasciolopsis buskii TaxID=27845 RepID=A0A8E0RLV7_9TREM|nr:X prolyl aminopeptidase [Fasciolopsis buski]